LIESYTSSGATVMTDGLALQGLALAGWALERAYDDGHDMVAREGMAMAALLSGTTLTNAGLGAVHGFAAPLGANFPVPHGVVCAALLPHVIRANVEALRASGHGQAGLQRYATIGRTLTTDEHMRDKEAIEACVQVTQKLAKEMRIQPLSRFNMTEEDVPAMVALAKKASSMRFNPVALTDEVLAGVLRAAI
jgi:alcohol dehydrogenase class IV